MEEGRLPGRGGEASSRGYSSSDSGVPGIFRVGSLGGGSQGRNRRLP